MVNVYSLSVWLVCLERGAHAVLFWMRQVNERAKQTEECWREGEGEGRGREGTGHSSIYVINKRTQYTVSLAWPGNVSNPSPRRNPLCYNCAEKESSSDPLSLSPVAMLLMWHLLGRFGSFIP